METSAQRRASHETNEALAWLLAALLLAASAVACGGDDDDDNGAGAVGADDDSVDDDNDDNGDDDDDSDDDNDSGDDDSDDDDDNDDNDDDNDGTPDPYPLFLVNAEVSNVGFAQYASWRQTASGWKKYSLPPVAADYQLGATRHDVGDFFMLEGRKAFSFVNARFSLLIPIMPTYGICYFYEQTQGARWLDFDLEAGWTVNEQRPPIAEGRTARDYFPTSEDEAWAGGFSLFVRGVFIDWCTEQINGQDRHALDYYHYADGQWTAAFDEAGYPSAASFASPTEGLIAQSDGLASYADGQWTARPFPAGFAGSVVRWLWMTEADRGYAILSRPPNWDREVIEIGPDGWTSVAAPAGCEAVQPRYVYAAGDRAVAYYPLPIAGQSPRVWEYRGGQWNCRILDLDPEHHVQSAVIMEDGRAFAVAGTGSLEYALFDITEDDSQPLTLPPMGDSWWIYAFGLGPTAPRYWWFEDAIQN